MSHHLLTLFREAAYGRFPPQDGRVEFLPSTGGADAIVGFTAHNVIATDLDPDVVQRHLLNDDPGAPMHPSFLAWFASQDDSGGYAPDILLAAQTPAAKPDMTLTPRYRSERPSPRHQFLSS
jgi:hypothetical protein